MTNEKKKKFLGELLKEKGLITEDHVRYALQVQKVTKEKMGEIFERLGFVTERDVVMTLAEQEKMAYIDLDMVLPDQRVLKMFNKSLCAKNLFLPIRASGQNLVVASRNMNTPALDQIISRQSSLSPVYFIAEKKKIINAIHKFYYFLENPVEKLIESEINRLSQDTGRVRGMDKIVDYILHMAVKMRSTDIHIQPAQNFTNISFRIDGVMTSILSLPASLKRIVTAFKMKADMDIAEQRLPQDGRFSTTILNNGYDFRVSTLVSPHGENMVLRVLPMESAIMGMQQLGFFERHIQAVGEMFREPFGIVLLTGPTGSGKSTTLYSGIRCLNLIGKNVITVEDPIEYEIPLLRQTQVNEKAGYNFANAIRNFLRHDPDVILVGEIRDSETAATAVTAATTGHTVLSTMHTNSAIGAIPRLRDLGIPSYLISDALLGVISQRLVRKICKNCKESYPASAWEKEYLKAPDLKTLYRGRGCKVCNGTGYFERTLVYELLSISKELAMLIERDADISRLTQKAKATGFVDLFDITIEKVKQGVTTSEEACRIMGHARQGNNPSPAAHVQNPGPTAGSRQPNPIVVGDAVELNQKLMERSIDEFLSTMSESMATIKTLFKINNPDTQGDAEMAYQKLVKKGDTVKQVLAMQKNKGTDTPAAPI